MIDTDLLLDERGLFHTVFPQGYNFVWRLLTLEEYRRFKGLKDSGAIHPFILHTLVFEHCFIGDPNLINNNLPAGIPIAIGECAMWLSGECEMHTLANDIDQAREFYPYDSVKEIMKQVIYLAWPGYVEEDLVKLTYPELIRKFVVAEHILQKRAAGEGKEYQPLNTRKIHGPEGPKQRKGIANFRQENREIERAMGDQVHALDKTPAEFEQMRQRNKGRLSRQLARRLDQRNKMRG